MITSGANSVEFAVELLHKVLHNGRKAGSNFPDEQGVRENSYVTISSATLRDAGTCTCEHIALRHVIEHSGTRITQQDERHT